MEFVISLVGAHSHEEQKKFEEFAKKAIKEYMPLKNKVKFLEFRCDNYERILNNVPSLRF